MDPIEETTDYVAPDVTTVDQNNSHPIAALAVAGCAVIGAVKVVQVVKGKVSFRSPITRKRPKFTVVETPVETPQS